MVLSQGLHSSYIELLDLPIEDVQEMARIYAELLKEQNKAKQKGK